MSSASRTRPRRRSTSSDPRLNELELPEQVRTQVDRELSRLEKIPQAAAEHGVIRTYLEWMASLPWGKGTVDNLDLKHAREVLDEDHYDIEKVKDRILEFLAVRKLKPDARGPILCLAGPPGVGKTSLGQSVARRWAASSSASASAACATSRRSAATGGPTSAPCPAPSSARCATPSRTTRSS